MRNRDPGWEKFGSGINILDPQHCIIGDTVPGQASDALILFLFNFANKVDDTPIP